VAAPKPDDEPAASVSHDDTTDARSNHTAKRSERERSTSSRDKRTAKATESRDQRTAKATEQNTAKATAKRGASDAGSSSDRASASDAPTPVEAVASVASAEPGADSERTADPAAQPAADRAAPEPVAAEPAAPAAAPQPSSNPAAGTAASALASSLDDLTIDVSPTGVHIRGHVSGEPVRPLGFMVEGEGGNAHYVVRLKDTRAAVGFSRMPVASSISSGVSVSEKDGMTTISIACNAAQLQPPSLAGSGSGFELALLTR